MIIIGPPKKQSVYHIVEHIRQVDVYIQEDPNHLQSHSYGEVIATVDRYKFFNNPRLQPSFIDKNLRNLGEITLNGTGINKARKKTESLLDRLGISPKLIKIHKYDCHPTRKENPMNID